MARTINTEDALRMMRKIQGGGGGIAQETDPTVPAWAKQPNKPTYTASEVGALPNTTKIPSKTSDLTNDSGYITGIPSEYVTESELNEKGYLTQHQDLSSYAKKAEVPTKTSALTNDSGFLTAVPSEYVTESELTAKKYLTSVPSEYITETELNAKGYLTQHQDLSSYAKKTELPTKTSQLTNDSGYLTTVPSEYVTDSELTAKGYLTSIPAEYVTDSELNSKGYLTQHQDLSDYAKKTDIPSVPTKTSQLTNDSGFLTSVPSEYVTDTELTAKGYLTAVPSEYVTETELTAKKYLTSVPSEYVTETELTAKGYASQTSVTQLSEEIANLDIFKKDTSAWSPVNELANVEWDSQGTYWSSDGSKTTTTAKYTATKELIKAYPNADYNTVGFLGAIRIYRANKTLIEEKTNTALASQFTFTTSEEAAYFGVAYRYDVLSTDTLVGNMQLIRNTISDEEYNALPSEADSLKTLYGKKIVCFGDSLFGMYRGETSAPAYVKNITGATVYNVGFGGCRMSTHPTSGYAEFSMWALAKAVAENNWSSQDSAASKGSDYFPDQLAILKGISFNDVDIAVIHYGTNDFGGSVAIGKDSASTVTNTVCGALRYSIEKLLSAYPHLKIYISLPVFRYWTASGVNTYSDTYKNGQNNTLVEVVEAIAEVAKEYNLPVINGYNGLGINKTNASTFLSDGTHHNEAGRKRFGEFIGANLISQQSAGGGGGSGVSEVRVTELINSAIGTAIGGAY